MKEKGKKNSIKVYHKCLSLTPLFTISEPDLKKERKKLPTYRHESNILCTLYQKWAVSDKLWTFFFLFHTT